MEFPGAQKCSEKFLIFRKTVPYTLYSGKIKSAKQKTLGTENQKKESRKPKKFIFLINEKFSGYSGKLSEISENFSTQSKLKYAENS